MQKQDQVTVEDIFKRDHFSQLSHHWTNQDARFANLDYRDRRSIERACLNGYLYILIERQSEKVPPVAEAYYAICSEIQRPFILVYVKHPDSRNPFANVIMDLTTSRRVIDDRHYSGLMHLILSASQSPYAKDKTWLGTHPVLMDYFVCLDVPQGADFSLASQLVEFIEKHNIEDLAWLGELGAYESIVNRATSMNSGITGPIWFARPLNYQSLERLRTPGWEPMRRVY